MLDQSEIKVGKVIKINDQPYVVLSASRNKTAMRKAYLITKLRNLIDGSMLEKTFTQGEKTEEADLERAAGVYLYKDENNAYFMNNTTFEQNSVDIETIAEQLKFLKDNTEVQIMYFEGKAASVTLPIKVTLEVVEAPPSMKGNSAGSITKTVKLETGAEVDVPVFVEQGDKIVINTEKGEYVERAN